MNNVGPQTGPAGPGTAPPSQMSNDFPGGVVHDWVVANAMAARARAIYRQADTDLTVAIRRAELRSENSEDYQKALNELARYLRRRSDARPLRRTVEHQLTELSRS